MAQAKVINHNLFPPPWGIFSLYSLHRPPPPLHLPTPPTLLAPVDARQAKKKKYIKMLLPFGRVCKIILARRVSSAYTSCWQFCVQPCTKHSAKKKKKKKKKRLILVWGFLRVFVGFCLHLATPLRLLGFFCSKSISEQRGWCVVFTVLYN